MTANPRIRQPIPVIHDNEWIGMTDRARLLQLFDAAYACRADLVVWQRDEPDALDALQAWGSGREVTVTAVPVALSGSDVRLEVAPLDDKHGRITVYASRTAPPR